MNMRPGTYLDNRQTKIMGQFSSTAFAKNGISHILLKEALENELY